MKKTKQKQKQKKTTTKKQRIRIKTIGECSTCIIWYFRTFQKRPREGQKAKANCSGQSGLKKANFLEFGQKKAKSAAMVHNNYNILRNKNKSM